MKQDERSCLKEIVAGRDTWPAFWQLFGVTIASEVYRFRFSDPSLVDDIYQELCIKLMRRNHAVIRRYFANPLRGSFAALLRRIVRNMLIDLLRDRNRWKVTDTECIELSTDQVPANEWSRNPGKQYFKANVLVKILLEVTGGDPDSKAYQILILRFVAGERVNVIAERFSMKQNTVTKRIKYYVAKVTEKYKYDLMEIINE